MKTTSYEISKQLYDIGFRVRKIPEFGDYVSIEQKRFGCENEFYCYKVISSGRTNYFRPVPTNYQVMKEMGDLEDCVKVICCGVVEEAVETFRLKDILWYPKYNLETILEALPKKITYKDLPTEYKIDFSEYDFSEYDSFALRINFSLGDSSSYIGYYVNFIPAIEIWQQKNESLADTAARLLIKLVEAKIINLKN